ncbi:MAG: S26 family signal peptidase [Proteobacteria bacterium]|nr:S26 family signal peptidase [Pseudomonadota bacterium]
MSSLKQWWPPLHGHRMQVSNTLIAAAIAVSWFALAPASIILLYNGSPSAPVGFYLRTADTPRIGSYVTVRAASVAPLYAALRNFSGPRDRFIKRIAAMGGARACARGDRVEVNGSELTRLHRDRAGRRLPAWQGCRLLARDEVFLIGDTPDSFDSRYWGPIRRRLIDGVWRRLFAPSPLGKRRT